MWSAQCLGICHCSIHIRDSSVGLHDSAFSLNLHLWAVILSPVYRCPFLFMDTGPADGEDVWQSQSWSLSKFLYIRFSSFNASILIIKCKFSAKKYWLKVKRCGEEITSITHLIGGHNTREFQKHLNIWFQISTGVCY